MKKIKNPAIEETTFRVREIDRRVSQHSEREYITLELVGEGGALDGLIAYANMFPNAVFTTQGRNALNALHEELYRDE